MGDNSMGQIGSIPEEYELDQMGNCSQPKLVEICEADDGKVPYEILCADSASFAVIKSKHSDIADEVYSWGDFSDGILGRKIETNNVNS